MPIATRLLCRKFVLTYVCTRVMVACTIYLLILMTRLLLLVTGTNVLGSSRFSAGRLYCMRVLVLMTLLAVRSIRGRQRRMSLLCVVVLCSRVSILRCLWVCLRDLLVKKWVAPWLVRPVRHTVVLVLCSRVVQLPLLVGHTVTLVDVATMREILVSEIGLCRVVRVDLARTVVLAVLVLTRSMTNLLLSTCLRALLLWTIFRSWAVILCSRVLFVLRSTALPMPPNLLRLKSIIVRDLFLCLVLGEGSLCVARDKSSTG